MTAEASVAVAGLRKAFGATPALAGVDLRLGPGVTGLLGPNGAGKTTLLRIVATVLAADDGSVRLLGRDPRHRPGRLEIRRRLGYLPQEPGFYRGFTAFEFVEYVAILKEMTDRRARRAEVRRVLELVDLGAVMHRRVKELSGGMRRRLALAQALLGRPALLVLDEPTVGLDPEQRLRIREVLSAAAPDCVVLVSTHATEDVAALCQRVVVLDGGRIRFDGAVGDLAELARDRVWLADERGAGAHVMWRTPDGRHRHLGSPPPGAELLAPTLEDGYLALLERRRAETAA